MQRVTNLTIPVHLQFHVNIRLHDRTWTRCSSNVTRWKIEGIGNDGLLLTAEACGKVEPAALIIYCSIIISIIPQMKLILDKSITRLFCCRFYPQSSFVP